MITLSISNFERSPFDFFITPLTSSCSDREIDWVFNGTPTQNCQVKTVPSKNNNSNLYNYITINFSTNISI